MAISTNGKRIFIARHGETIFNRAGRLQGMDAHTPLTWEGCEQAARMGEAMRHHMGGPSALKLVASPSGRTLQTLSLICEQIFANYHTHETDQRLREIDVGEWEGQYYADLSPDIGELIDREDGLFRKFAPSGEDYAAVALRLRQWIADQRFDRDMLIISHGMTARVLRGLLLGLPDLPGYRAPIACSLSQGSMVVVSDGIEQRVINGDGRGEKA